MAETQAGEDREVVGGDLVSETLAYLARAIVEHVDQVSVEQGESDRGLVYRLRVHPDDMGRVIGRNGRVARAIRQVARVAAARVDTTAVIEIGD
ncbi:MAG: KH domain-containing protein [Actinomycetota bacterium]